MDIAKFLARGLWTEDRIQVTWSPALKRATTPEIEAGIEREWARILATGRNVYDGQLCRVDDYRADASGLEITTGPTTYREYRGTNRSGISDTHRANPLCVCAVAHTSDDWLVLGRRSQTVGESAGLWHVAGGHIESGRHLEDGRVLPALAVREELEEELGIPPTAIVEMRCLGFTRPEDLLKPELVYYARVGLRFEDIRPDSEHSMLRPVPARRQACLDFLDSHSIVPSGRACLEAYADLLP